jgi:hypothetical protein
VSDEVWAITLDETPSRTQRSAGNITQDESGAPSGVVKGGWDLKVNKSI